MAAIFSSSVIALCIWLIALELGFDEALAVCSLRLAFFADAGILPDT